ncbi:MAG: nucleoside 2-deoxyribosyltransferase [Hyphomicrobium sp.]|nr:MAG: nucleoside 2-deoxyribosyltransferase [Hyphomicrobium sp.]
MMKVVGGVYSEYCYDPHWHQIFGSGGRGAAALKVLGVPKVELHSCLPNNGERTVAASLNSYGMELHNIRSSPINEFRYTHPLSEPQWNKKPGPLECIGSICDDCIVAYGMVEGYVTLSGKTIIYDPQAEDAETPLDKIIISSERLALVLNEREVIRMGDSENYVNAAQRLLNNSGAQVIIVKRGPYGCSVIENGNIATIPVYQSSKIFKIGTGDIFTAAFAYYWSQKNFKASEAADAASRCVSAYAETQSIDAIVEQNVNNRKPILVKRKPKVYLAGPFFSLSQRFLIEEAKRALESLSADVFSPLHEVGLEDTPQEIATADLRGLDQCTAILALITDLDVGTIFEIGYATAKDIPVVAYSEGVKDEHLTMLMGSGCVCSSDFCSAIYQSIWAAV